MIACALPNRAFPVRVQEFGTKNTAVIARLDRATQYSRDAGD
jgi:hypothetical protein